MTNHDPLPVDRTESGAFVQEQAEELESELEDHHETCPECGEDYVGVTLFLSGTVQFTHHRGGLLTEGCAITDHERIEEDILP